MGKTWKKVPLKTSMHIRVLHQDFGYKISKIKEKYPKIPTRTINYHAKIPTNDEIVDRRHTNKGRPKKLSERDCRHIKNTVINLRKRDTPNFSAVKLQNLCGLQRQCSTRTIHRALKKMDFHYVNTRQKGLTSKKDHKLRVTFASKAIKKVGPDLWLKRISFYYDGVSFYHKLNPFNEAIAPKSKIWRKSREGLTMTAKGKKEGNNGRCVKLFVAISYGKGVVMCKAWDPEIKFNGANYKEFVKKHWPRALERSTNPRNKLVLQDGDPVQKSKQAYLAYDAIGCKIFSIPPRIPDLNPIENVFHLVRCVYFKIFLSSLIVWGGGGDSTQIFR